RVTRRTVPGSDSSGELSTYTRRELRLDDTGERPGLYYAAKVTLPFASGGAFGGPAHVRFTTAGGRVFRSSSFSLAYNQDYPPYGTAYTLGDELSRSTTQHTLTGLASSRRRWHDLAADAYYQTSYAYDALGRL